jgi:hypothetical protein
LLYLVSTNGGIVCTKGGIVCINDGIACINDGIAWVNGGIVVGKYFAPFNILNDLILNLLHVVFIINVHLM